MVRPGAGEQDSHRVRIDGVLRHVEGLRRRPATHRTNPTVAGCDNSRRMEAGSQTRNSSTKARRTATTRTCCASPPTLPGRSRTRDIRDETVERAGASWKRTWGEKADTYTLAVSPILPRVNGSKDRDFTRQRSSFYSTRAPRKMSKVRWTARRDRSLRKRRKRQRGNDGFGGAGFAAVGRSRGYGSQGPQLPCIEERTRTEHGAQRRPRSWRLRALLRLRKKQRQMCKAQ